MTKTGGKKAENPVYLTTQEVADRLRVTRRTVYTWIKETLLRADKVGPKIWVVSEQELADFLVRSRPKPRRMFDQQSADSSKWGKGRQRPAAPPAALPAALPAAPASAVQPVQPVPPQNPVERRRLPIHSDLLEAMDAAFVRGEFETVGEAHAAYAAFEGPSPSSIPPAKISSKKRGGRRR
jgi:excisionase family DNA binding protein